MSDAAGEASEEELSSLRLQGEGSGAHAGGKGED